MRLTNKRSRLLLGLLGIHRYLLEGAASDLSQIVPNDKLLVENFSTSVNHRQNFCEEQEMISTQTKLDGSDVDLKIALKGKHINIAVGNDPNFVNFNPDMSINPDDPGLMIVLLDEMAKRGGFSWRDSFVIEQPPSGNQTWQDLLLWSVDTFDLSANWWFFTSERSSLGVSFPRGWYDATLAVIAKKDEDDSSSFEPFSWGKPFTTGVWIALAGTLLISGIICFFLEETRLRKKADKTFVSVITSYIHASFIVFTGHLDLLPTSHPGQLVSFSLSFFALLMLSAYTANLCSFLVVQKSAFKLNIESLSDVVRLRKTLCIYGSDSAAQVAVQTTYTDAKLVEKPNDLETILGLQNNDCDYAIIGKDGWAELERTEKTNGKCNLARVGRTFKNFEAGFATKSDAGNKCTSLVRDVINSIIYEMYEDDFVKQAWTDHLAKKQDIITPCTDDSSSATTKEVIDTLDMTNLGGIFMFHFILVAISILIAVRPKYSCGKNKKKTNDDEDDSKDNSPKQKGPFHAPSQGGKIHLGRESRYVSGHSPFVDLEDSNKKVSKRHGPQIRFMKGASALDLTPSEDSSSVLSSDISQGESSNTLQSLLMKGNEQHVSNELKENVGVEEQLSQMERNLSEVEGQLVQIMSAFREINITYSRRLRRDDSDCTDTQNI